jgi:hypothetical protein
MRDDKGQMQTIEGIIAAFLVIFALVVIVQTTSVTPLSSSFTNQHIKLELQNMGNDILSTLDETPYSNVNNDPMIQSELEASIITWLKYDNFSMFTWNGTTFIAAMDNNTIITNTPLINALNFSLIRNGTAFNVELRYPDKNGFVRITKMVWNGDPSENSVTVSRYIALRDSDVNGDVIPDISSTDLHNTVEIRLTLWVM